MNLRRVDKKIVFKKFLVDSTIIFLKFLAITFNGLLGLLLTLKRPFKVVARFVFYKFVVKIYCQYLSLVKKIGWNRNKKGFLFFLFNEKIVHVIVVVITVLTVLTNLVPFTDAMTGPNGQGGPIIYNLVQSEFGELEQGEELIEEYLDKETLSQQVNIQRRYIDDSLALRTDSWGYQEDAMPEDRIEADSDLPEVGDDEELLEDREEIVRYTVRVGDTISGIARRFGISSNTILWENNLGTHDLIRAGDELTILPMTGVRHEVSRGQSLSYISSKYDVSSQEIIEANQLENPERLSVGEKLIIPGGEKQTVQETTQAPSRSTQSTVSAVRDIVSPQEPSTQPSSKMHWPTTGHRITQYYSWRHNGLDIADNIGTPLFAAEAGTVEFAGWSRGYGYNIVINHGGGKKTRYAHMNRFYVSHGQRVSRGQTIGEMGNTGWSTGPHIHFEVIVNGVRQNPLDYLR